MRRVLLYSLSSIILICLAGPKSKAQGSVLFEAGATYFTNDIENPATNLLDFLAVTFTTRVILTGNENSSLSLDIPISIRSKIKRAETTRFGMHLPALLTYNFGAGASGKPNSRKFGAFAGAGFGYFYQKSNSEKGDTPVYNEKLSVAGPVAQLGVRFTLPRITLFNVNERAVHPYMAIKTTYQADLNNRQHDIGSLSVLMGIKF